jgi:hypothetical protein
MKKIICRIVIFFMMVMALAAGCDDVSGDSKPGSPAHPTPDVIPEQTSPPGPISTTPPEPISTTPPGPQETSLPVPTISSTPTLPPAQQTIPIPVESPETPTPETTVSPMPTETPESTTSPIPTETPLPTASPTLTSTQPPGEITSPPGPNSLIITEIMYNPRSPDGEWEWIEIYNTSHMEINLNGWVIDDGNKTPHTEANINAGLLLPGESGILYNSDVMSPHEFETAWGHGLQLIPVRNWGAMGLNNSGDKIGIWDSFASYQDDHELFVNVHCFLNYSGESGWPESDGQASIYLTDINMSYTDGNNWQLSSEGTETPLGTCYKSTRTPGGLNSGEDIGSPYSR